MSDDEKSWILIYSSFAAFLPIPIGHFYIHVLASVCFGIIGLFWVPIVLFEGNVRFYFLTRFLIYLIGIPVFIYDLHRFLDTEYSTNFMLFLLAWLVGFVFELIFFSVPELKDWIFKRK